MSKAWEGGMDTCTLCKKQSLIKVKPPPDLSQSDWWHLCSDCACEIMTRFPNDPWVRNEVRGLDPKRHSSVSKDKLRQRCVDLIRDITMFERNGEYGHPVWHRAQEALGRALAAYRELGATNAEVIQLGLQRTEQSNG